MGSYKQMEPTDGGGPPPPPEYGSQSDGIVSDVRIALIGAVQDYGWFILLGLATVYYAYTKLNNMRNTPSSSRNAGSSTSSSNTEDAMKFLERREKIAAARARMQEKIDAQAAIEKEKIREREERERENKIQQWDNLQSGKGYYSKTK